MFTIKQISQANIPAGLMELDGLMDYPWQMESFLEFLERPDSHLIVVHYGPNSEELIAFCLISIDEAQNCHLYKICVKEEFRRLGVARTLLLYCSEQLLVNKVYLEVRESNDDAVKFYQSLAARELKQMPKYYSDGENAVSYEIVCR